MMGIGEIFGFENLIESTRVFFMETIPNFFNEAIENFKIENSLFFQKIENFKLK